jgi:hypothetical protein
MPQIGINIRKQNGLFKVSDTTISTRTLRIMLRYAQEHGRVHSRGYWKGEKCIQLRAKVTDGGHDHLFLELMQQKPRSKQ